MFIVFWLESVCFAKHILVKMFVYSFSHSENKLAGNRLSFDKDKKGLYPKATAKLVSVQAYRIKANANTYRRQNCKKDGAGRGEKKSWIKEKNILIWENFPGIDRELAIFWQGLQ